MTHITAYAYEADYHCIECTHEATATQRSSGECPLDENAIPLEWRDKEGNTVSPVFSTDELPTRLRETSDHRLQWHEYIECYTCGTCREQFSFLTGEVA